MAVRETLQSVVQNYIHEPTQFPENENRAFLTVQRIGRISEAGSLDFGGSEYSEAEIIWIESKLRSEDDTYGWWNLSEGSYHIEYNEDIILPDDTGVLVQIWQAAARNGMTHPTVVFTESRSPLRLAAHVSRPGIAIKENARLSELRLL